MLDHFLVIIKTDSAFDFHLKTKIIFLFHFLTNVLFDKKKDLKAAFTMFDKNGDQKISANELLQVMQYLGLSASEKEVKAMIQVVDKNSM